MGQIKLKLGNFLKQKREQAGLSQGDVAEKLGYSTSQFISNWERGLSGPPLKVLRQVSDLYGVSPENLFNLLLEFSVMHHKESMISEFQKIRKNKRA